MARAMEDEGGGDSSETSKLEGLVRCYRKKYSRLKEQLELIKQDVRLQQRKASTGVHHRARSDSVTGRSSLSDSDSDADLVVEALEDQVADLKRQLADKEAAAARHRQWGQSIKQQLAEAAKMLQAKDDVEARRVAQLQLETQHLRTELEAAKHDRLNMETTLADAQRAAKENEASRRVAEAAAAALEEEVERLSRASTQRTPLGHEATDSSSPTQAVPVTQEQAAAGGRESQLRTLQEENEMLRADIVRLVSMHGKSREEAGTRQDRAQPVVEELREQLRAWQDRCRHCNEEASKLCGEVSSKRAAAEKECHSLKQTISRLQTMNKSQQDHLNRKQQEVDHLRDMAERQQREMEELRRTIAGHLSAEDEIRRLTAEAAEKSAQVAALQASAQDTHRLVEEMSGLLAHWKEQVAQRECVVRQQAAENETLQTELQGLNRELTGASEKLVAYERRLAQLEEGSLRDRQRDADLQATKRQLLKDRMALETTLMRELKRVSAWGGLADRFAASLCRDGTSNHEDEAGGALRHENDAAAGQFAAAQHRKAVAMADHDVQAPM